MMLRMSHWIRAAAPEDLDTIVAFNAAIAFETEHKHIDQARLRGGVAALLADAAKGRYFLAADATGVLGQLMVTDEWSDWRNGRFWWIQSVYVRPDARGRGVFESLYRHVERLSHADPQVCGLRLYVEHANTRAQRTYLRCGMVNAGYQVMEVDYTGGPPRTEEESDARERHQGP
jgi:ribosomal protein S18 acetylase RimI-like enzyme